MLALLLVVDFELGARLMDPSPDGREIAGALGTALVAGLLALLALVRRWMPGRSAVAAGLTLSLVASLAAAAGAGLSLSLTETAALLVLTAAAVGRDPSTPGILVTGAAALTVGLLAVLLRIGSAPTVVSLALLVWACAIAIGLAGRQLRRRRERAEEDHRRAERLELARELHDVVAHQVGGIVVQAQAATAVPALDPGRAAEVFTAIESAGLEALEGMRRMVGAIREESAEDASPTVPYGLGDIPGLVEAVDLEGVSTVLELEDATMPLPPGVGETAYRVVREALTNVRRHAPEGRARVRVRVRDTRLELEIDNDGVPPRPRRAGPGGYGLTGMSERVDALGGTMRAGAREPDGWTVHVVLPLERNR